MSDDARSGDGGGDYRRPGRAPSFLAFHGFTGTTSELRPTLDAVAAAGFAVEAPLLPGHGTTPSDLQNRTFDEWLSAGRAHRDRLLARGDSLVLCGFSMGSLVALALAAETTPRLRGLVVLGNAVELAIHSSLPFRLFDRLGLRVPDAYLKKPRRADMEDRVAAQSLTSYDRHPLRSAMEVYRAGLRVRPLVGKITCPTLVLHGAKDHVCPRKNAAWVADHVASRDVTVRVYERSAHVVAADFDRDAVARDVVGFLQRLPVEP